MHCVDLGESFPTSICLQNLASIQPRTSLLTFARSPRTDPTGIQQKISHFHFRRNLTPLFKRTQAPQQIRVVGSFDNSHILERKNVANVAYLPSARVRTVARFDGLWQRLTLRQGPNSDPFRPGFFSAVPTSHFRMIATLRDMCGGAIRNLSKHRPLRALNTAGRRTLQGDM